MLPSGRSQACRSIAKMRRGDLVGTPHLQYVSLNKDRGRLSMEALCGRRMRTKAAIWVPGESPGGPFFASPRAASQSTAAECVWESAAG